MYGYRNNFEAIALLLPRRSSAHEFKLLMLSYKQGATNYKQASREDGLMSWKPEFLVENLVVPQRKQNWSPLQRSIGY
jgi:hypothetical protein